LVGLRKFFIFCLTYVFTRPIVPQPPS
jgi:hypothetical protein